MSSASAMAADEPIVAPARPQRLKVTAAAADCVCRWSLELSVHARWRERRCAARQVFGATGIAGLPDLIKWRRSRRTKVGTSWTWASGIHLLSPCRRSGSMTTGQSIDPAMAAVDTFYRDVEPAGAERRASALRVATAAILQRAGRTAGLADCAINRFRSAPKIGRSALIGSSRWRTEPTPTSCDGPRATTHSLPPFRRRHVARRPRCSTTEIQDRR